MAGAGDTDRVSPEPLAPAEEEAWRAIARLMVMLPRAIEEDLLRRAGLRLTPYVVLMALSEAPDRQLPMSALAERVAISASRMTRVVDDLERAGYVVRQSTPQNHRISMARLCDAGLARLNQAWPAHLAGVRHLVLDHLDPAELAPVTHVVRRLLAALEQAGDPPSSGG